MGKTDSQQKISLVNILNAFKKNVLTIFYVLLSALLVGVLYSVLLPPKYSSSARLVSKVAINATNESRITSALLGEGFLTVAVDKLADADIKFLEDKPITKEVLGNGLSGKLLSENGVIYDITFVSGEENAIVGILTVVRSEFLDFLKNDTGLSAIGNNFELISTPTLPVSAGPSRVKILLIAGAIGIVISVAVIFIADVWKGSIYDKRDLIADNLIELKLPKKYKKISIRNFMTWPTVPVNISKALTKGDNSAALTRIQDRIIAKVGFDNNIQVFYTTNKESVHEIFIEAYAKNFVSNGKKVIVINLAESDKKFLNLREEMIKGETPIVEEIDSGKNLASEGKRVIVLDLSESKEKALDVKEKKTKDKTTKIEKQVYAVVGIKGEQYPASIVNNSAFINYIKKLGEKYDFVIINAGVEVEQYQTVLSKLADPIVGLYSGYTNKSEYRKTMEKLNDPSTITLIVD